MRTSEALWLARKRLGAAGRKGPMKAPSIIGKVAFDDRERRTHEALQYEVITARTGYASSVVKLLHAK